MTKRDLSVLEGLDQKSIDSYMKTLSKESHRGSILVSIAILDAMLKARLKQLLDRGNSEARDRLLSPPLGRLSSFSAKVDFAFCIGLLPRPMYDDIRLLNKLRNQCAHDWEAFEFTEEIFDKFVQPMNMKRALDAANEEQPIIFPPGMGPSTRFVKTMAAMITFANLWKPFGGEDGMPRRKESEEDPPPTSS